MKIITTANLTILKTWLIGGQINPMGGWCEGFHSLTRFDEDSIKNNKINKKLLEQEIESLLEFFGKDPGIRVRMFADPAVEEVCCFIYYDDYYRFKMPSEKNFKILVKRIKKELEQNLLSNAA